MSKDYVKRQSSNKRKQKGKAKKSYWKLWILTILLIGLFITGLVQLNNHQANHSRVIHKTLNEKKDTPAPTQSQPQFDFYTILPKEQVDVTKLSASSNVKIKYFLQVAEVNDDANAEHLKSELALLGFEVYINKIKTNNNGVLNQINIGPYFSYQAAQADQKRLVANNIKSILQQEKK